MASETVVDECVVCGEKFQKAPVFLNEMAKKQLSFSHQVISQLTCEVRLEVGLPVVLFGLL